MVIKVKLFDVVKGPELNYPKSNGKKKLLKDVLITYCFLDKLVL